MLHHVSVGVRDVAQAAKFYDPVLAALGYKRVMEVMPYGIGYGDTHPEFWVQLPADRDVASVGNGVHMPTSHSPMISRPELVTDLLLSIADGLSTA